MDLLGVTFGKIVLLACKITGKGGTSLPGKLTLKLCPNIIKDLINGIKNEKVAITGTNGKTTTSGLIASILKASKKKVVHNREGAKEKVLIC
nr:Mur ligase family protein [Thermoanaerobacterium sp. RBIITD]